MSILSQWTNLPDIIYTNRELFSTVSTLRRLEKDIDKTERPISWKINRSPLYELVVDTSNIFNKQTHLHLLQLIRKYSGVRTVIELLHKMIPGAKEEIELPLIESKVPIATFLDSLHNYKHQRRTYEMHMARLLMLKEILIKRVCHILLFVIHPVPDGLDQPVLLSTLNNLAPNTQIRLLQHQIRTPVDALSDLWMGCQVIDHLLHQCERNIHTMQIAAEKCKNEWIIMMVTESVNRSNSYKKRKRPTSLRRSLRIQKKQKLTFRQVQKC